MTKLIVIALIVTLATPGYCSDFESLLEKVKQASQDNPATQDDILTPGEEVLEKPALGL